MRKAKPRGKTQYRLGFWALLWVSLALPLWGCSDVWSPLYDTNITTPDGKSVALADFSEVAIARIPDREGQLLRRALKRYLSYSKQYDTTTTKPKVTLHTFLQWNDVSRGDELSLTTHNTHTVLNAKFWLSPSDSPQEKFAWSEQKIILHRSIFYNYDDFAELSAQREVRRQMVEELAHQIFGRMLYFKQLYPNQFAALNSDDPLAIPNTARANRVSSGTSASRTLNVSSRCG